MRRIKYEVHDLDEEGWYWSTYPRGLILQRWRDWLHIYIRVDFTQLGVTISWDRAGKVISDVASKYSYVKDYRIQGTPDRYKMQALEEIMKADSRLGSFGFKLLPWRTR